MENKIIFILIIILFLGCTSTVSASQSDRTVEIIPVDNKSEEFQVGILLNNTTNTEVIITSDNLRIVSEVSEFSGGIIEKEGENRFTMAGNTGMTSAYLINVTIVDAQSDGEVKVSASDYERKSNITEVNYSYKKPEAKGDSKQIEINGSIEEEEKKEAKGIIERILYLFVELVKVIVDIIADLIDF